MNAFKNKVRCNNCEAVFYENFIIKEDEGSVCPVCGGIGYLMNIPEKEFPQYYFQVPVYPILSKCNDFNKMLKDLSNDDLQYIENVLQKYDKGQINMYTNKNGEHIFVEDRQICFGGIKLEILKWYESLIGTEDLIEQISELPF
jgi:hypothetical protein